MDSEWIPQAQKGDHDAFIQLIKKYDKDLMSVVYRFSGNRFDREDIYQDILMHVFSSIDRYKFEASFRTWLYRVALNRCFSYMNKNVRIEAIEQKIDSYDSLSPIGNSNSYEQREKIDSITNALLNLEGSQHISFFLFYIEDWTANEIANLLECNEGTVKSHLNRARMKVRKNPKVSVWMKNT